jgi:hypothetical protein
LVYKAVISFPTGETGEDKPARQADADRGEGMLLDQALEAGPGIRSTTPYIGKPAARLTFETGELIHRFVLEIADYPAGGLSQVLGVVENISRGLEDSIAHGVLSF